MRYVLSIMRQAQTADSSNLMNHSESHSGSVELSALQMDRYTIVLLLWQQIVKAPIPAKVQKSFT